jgi:hypothetical protein
MLTETDDEALEAESREDVLLDAAVAYEAGISKAEGRALRAAVLRGAPGSGADAGAGAEMNRDGANAMRLRKRKNGRV